MDLGIAGREAIVCGASKGLGRGAATALAAEGCDVVIAVRGGAAVRAAAEAIGAETGRRVAWIVAVVTTEAGSPRSLSSGRRNRTRGLRPG